MMNKHCQCMTSCVSEMVIYTLIQVIRAELTSSFTRSVVTRRRAWTTQVLHNNAWCSESLVLISQRASRWSAGSGARSRPISRANVLFLFFSSSPRRRKGPDHPELHFRLRIRKTENSNTLLFFSHIRRDWSIYLVTSQTEDMGCFLICIFVCIHRSCHF